MKTEIEAAIKALVKRTGEQTDSGDAMRFSQAVQNLANAFATLDNAKSKLD